MNGRPAGARLAFTRTDSQSTGDARARAQGLPYEQHEIGARDETPRRTVNDADLSTFVNLCGFNEPLFMDIAYDPTLL